MAADSGIITASLRELAEGLGEAVTEQTMELEETDLMTTAELERLMEPSATESDSGSEPADGAE
jgi:hypothetical protein